MVYLTQDHFQRTHIEAEIPIQSLSLEMPDDITGSEFSALPRLHLSLLVLLIVVSCFPS